MIDNNKIIKIFYVNLGLDTFDDIKNVLASDTSNKYKTCMDDYVTSQSVCENGPDIDSIVDHFKKLDPNNVNNFFACNPFTFMPFITSASKRLLDKEIPENIDVFVAGEMCKFDYDANYNHHLSINSIKEYSRKSANAAYLIKTQKPTQNRGYRGQVKSNIGYQIKGSTNLPVIESDIDVAILNSMAALGYDNEKKNIDKATFSAVRESSKKLFFIGRRLPSFSMADTANANALININCNTDICDELQMIKTIIKGKPFIIINVHNRTYATTNFNQYIDLFMPFIKNVANQFTDHNIVILGDFNIGKNDSDVLKNIINNKTINQSPNIPVIRFINEMNNNNFINASVVKAYHAYEAKCDGINKTDNILIFYKLLYNADVTVDNINFCDKTLVTSSHYPIILTINERIASNILGSINVNSGRPQNKQQNKQQNQKPQYQNQPKNKSYQYGRKQYQYQLKQTNPKPDILVGGYRKVYIENKSNYLLLNSM